MSELTRIPRTLSTASWGVLLLIATEVIVAVLIRDNLLLNIINLIRPIGWITQWQDGG